MKILIVGNDPNEIGGVANYTRPLSTVFAKMGHEVFYLYSGAFASRYDLRLRPYLKIRHDEFPFERAEIINSTCFPFNYGDPDRDVSIESMEQVIGSYLDRIKPDVMHVHSRLGLPFSINRLAFERGIKVINTIHVYGYLCQKRVMIDSTGAPCPGPLDLTKCAACTGSLDFKVELRQARIRSFKEFLKGRSNSLYSLLRDAKNSAGVSWTPGFKANSRSDTPQADPTLVTRLTKRLAQGLEALNRNSHLVICVSNDVRNTLIQYGVKEEQILVQHIGSLIADKQEYSDRPLHEPLVIGNIGGVNYYKGTHVLLDAIAKVRSKGFVVKIFGKYHEQYVVELMAKRKNLPVEFTGRYKPEDLPQILQQIDIMVLPSICNDTAPQTIFESFSGGVPIIASNIGGFPDFVQHNRNGLLFEAGNSDDLACQIEFLLNNRARIIDYKTNIPKLKTITDNVIELIDLYNAMLQVSQK